MINKVSQIFITEEEEVILPPLIQEAIKTVKTQLDRSIAEFIGFVIQVIEKYYNSKKRTINSDEFSSMPIQEKLIIIEVYHSYNN